MSISNKMNVPVYVVNMKKDVLKKENFIKNNDKFLRDYEFVDAVEGSQIDMDKIGYNERKAILYIDRPLIRGEIGCYLSHMVLYQKLLDSSASHALLLEDDVVLTDLTYPVTQGIVQDNINFDILLLHNYATERPYSIKLVHHYKNFLLYRSFDQIWGTSGYIVSRSGAKKLLKYKNNIYLPIDHLGRDARPWYNAFLKVYCISPDIMTEFKLESALEMERNEIKNEYGTIHLNKYGRLRQRCSRVYNNVRKIVRYYTA